MRNIRVNRIAVTYLVIVIGFSVGCVTTTPTAKLIGNVALKTLKVALSAAGGDLIRIASVNHSEKYADQMENLLLSLVKEVGGLNIQRARRTSGDCAYNQTDDGSGYVESYCGDQPPPDCDPNSDPYCQSVSTEFEQYPESDCDFNTDPNCQIEPAYTTDIADTCDPFDDPDCQLEQDGFEQELQEENRTTGFSDNQISFDFTLLKHTPNGSVPVSDGDVLYGPRQGRPEDRIKINFSTMCACHVYIVGIDSTGFTAQIFPDPESGAFNPTQISKNYELPGGETWWGLDSQQGTETIYLIISHEPRPDIEELVATMSASAVRSRGSAQPVVNPLLASSRGLRKVSVAGSQAADNSTARSDSYVAYIDDVQADTIVTRWFQHQ